MSERIYPDELGPMHDMANGHRFRYLFARGFLNSGEDVLDAACGCGYGTFIMSQVPGVKIVGYDYDESPIEYANKHYTRTLGSHGSQTTFHLGDLDKIVFARDSVDVAVSFETIEHLVQEPKVFANKLKSASRRLIIVSAPIVPTVGTNHYHKHDLTDDQMVGLFRDDEWMLYEKVKQRVYGIYVFVRKTKVESLR